ncbi:aminomethyl-transferring glycine dehydrogenase subunit GcvPB [Eubacteriales bacterium OttesenSCG-928-K08]|nr:aminomethyl-transferring glycine dehydrogenase subunit GcvPB [Eubacteriales bacterium OttesenSCG-928-K08]
MRSSAPLLFELSKTGRRAADLPPMDVPELDGLLPEELVAKEPLPLPEMSEVELIRHYTRLSRRNFGVDNGSYPLGSCTMKYNPKINEQLPACFNKLHPLLDELDLLPVWELMHALGELLCELCGMDQFTHQPAAGAHGELTGLMLIKAYHDTRLDHERNEILVPDAAHGTNPASAALAGFKTIEVPSTADGDVDIEALKALVGPRTAGLMLTNPSTLGLFERNILEISNIVHDAGGLLYYDGANMNAIMGIARPGDMGFDVVHLNLHKTLSTPHGGGGPGAGSVGVKKELIPYLPAPVILKRHGGPALPDYNRPLSIGRVKAFYGNFSVLVKAYAYVLSLGGAGLKQASENAVLNANYVQHHLKGEFGLANDRVCMHECVLTPGPLLERGIHTTDIAKALIDRGFHPPTIYFPLIVPEAMMFEPTETETRENLDELIAAMLDIAEVSKTDPEALHRAPETTPIGRPDETRAARNPVVRFVAEPKE